jgi:hypothetical protein
MRLGIWAVAGLLLLGACSSGSGKSTDDSPSDTSGVASSAPPVDNTQRLAAQVVAYQDEVAGWRASINKCVTVDGYPNCSQDELDAVAVFAATNDKLAADLAAAPRPPAEVTEVAALYDATRLSVAAIGSQLTAWSGQQCATPQRVPECAMTAQLVSFSVGSIADQIDRWKPYTG